MAPTVPQWCEIEIIVLVQRRSRLPWGVAVFCSGDMVKGLQALSLHRAFIDARTAGLSISASHRRSGSRKASAFVTSKDLESP